MDVEPPIAYQMLDEGVRVLASGGEPVGTVASVLAAPEKDVFHGLLVDTDAGLRFVEAAAIGALHEHSVELRLNVEQARALPEREQGSPVFSERPDRQQGWRHWVRMITGGNDWNRPA